MNIDTQLPSNILGKVVSHIFNVVRPLRLMAKFSSETFESYNGGN